MNDVNRRRKIIEIKEALDDIQILKEIYFYINKTIIEYDSPCPDGKKSPVDGAECENCFWEKVCT